MTEHSIRELRDALASDPTATARIAQATIPSGSTLAHLRNAARALRDAQATFDATMAEAIAAGHNPTEIHRASGVSRTTIYKRKATR